MSGNAKNESEGELGLGTIAGVAVAGILVTFVFCASVRVILRYMNQDIPGFGAGQSDTDAGSARVSQPAVGGAASDSRFAEEARHAAIAANKAVAEAAAMAAVAEEKARLAESHVARAQEAAAKVLAVEREASTEPRFPPPRTSQTDAAAPTGGPRASSSSAGSSLRLSSWSEDSAKPVPSQSPAPPRQQSSGTTPPRSRRAPAAGPQQAARIEGAFKKLTGLRDKEDG